MTDQAAAVHRLLLRVPKRRTVFEAIVACPGTHARRLSRDLGMALGVVEHHVRHLERHGLVYAHQAGRRRTLYAVGHVSPEDAPVLHLLRKPTWCRMLVALARAEHGVTELASALSLPPAMVSYNLRRLRALGVLGHVRAGREAAYYLREPERVRRLLEAVQPRPVRPAPTGWQGLVERAREHTRSSTVLLAVED